VPSGRLAADDGAMSVGVDEGEDMMGIVYEPLSERDLCFETVKCHPTLMRILLATDGPVRVLATDRGRCREDEREVQE